MTKIFSVVYEKILKYRNLCEKYRVGSKIFHIFEMILLGLSAASAIFAHIRSSGSSYNISGLSRLAAIWSMLAKT